MKKFSTFDIPFAGLSLGKHQFEFELDEAFFQEFDNDSINDSNLKVVLEFEKDDNIFTLLFRINGTLTKKCDRCLGDLELEVSEEKKMLVKFDSDPEEKEVDDIIVMSRNDHQINVSQHIYDFVTLSLPMRSVHDEGECDPKIEELLGKNIVKEEVEVDPRWDKLKGIETK
jgi:uncharacterized metal-binding protein YceD (DUF177 family)